MLEVRPLARYVDLELVCSATPILHQPCAIAGFELPRIQISVCRFGSEDLGRGARIDTGNAQSMIRAGDHHVRSLLLPCPPHGRVGLPGLILPAPLRQRPVPGEAGHARGPQEIAALHIRGIECDAVRNQHDADSSTARATPSSNFRFLCDRLP